MTLALELGRDDLVDVEEAVLLEADLDERGFHTRQNVVDRAEVDVPGDRAALGPFQIHLGDAVVLEDGDPLLADVDGHEQLALRLRQRCAALRFAAPACLRALAPLGRLLPRRLLRLRLGRLGLRLGRRLGTAPSAAATATASRLCGGGACRLSRLGGRFGRYGLRCFCGSGSLNGRLLL